MRAAATALALWALLASQAWGGYAALRGELDGYQPPALLRPAPAAAAPALSAPSELDSQLARLREGQARWEKTLTAPAADTAFFTPDPVLAASVKSAVTDAGYAEGLLKDRVTLPLLEVLALARNPAIAAKEREVRAVLSQYSQLEALDGVLRRYATLTASAMGAVGSLDNPDAVAVKFPFPGVLALKGQIVGQEAAAAREALEIAKRDTLTAVRKAYWEVVYLQKAGETSERMLELLDGLKTAASARYAAGTGSFQDVVRAGLEREKTREERVTLTAELHHMHSELVEALALPPVHHLGAAEDQHPPRELPDLAGLYRTAAERRQELRTMGAMVAKMERMVEMAETMVYPGFSLNLSVPRRTEIARVGAAATMGGGQETESFPSTTEAGMGAGLPKMPWFGRDDAYLGETRARLDALRQNVKMEEAATNRGVHEGWFRLDKALREEALYRDRVVPLARSAAEAALQTYAAGRGMFSDVIESYSGWFQAALGAERARADVGLARAGLEAAVGSSTLGK